MVWKIETNRGISQREPPPVPIWTTRAGPNSLCSLDQKGGETTAVRAVVFARSHSALQSVGRRMYFGVLLGKRLRLRLARDYGETPA
jgi:hypothetical protein